MRRLIEGLWARHTTSPQSEMARIINDAEKKYDKFQYSDNELFAKLLAFIAQDSEKIQSLISDFGNGSTHWENIGQFLNTIQEVYDQISTSKLLSKDDLNEVKTRLKNHKKSIENLQKTVYYTDSYQGKSLSQVRSGYATHSSDVAKPSNRKREYSLEARDILIDLLATLKKVTLLINERL